MKNIFKTAHRSHNRERRESPQSARYALLRRWARQAIQCGPGDPKIQVKSCGSSPCGTPGTKNNFPSPMGRCRPSQHQTKSRPGSLSSKTAGARPTPDETSRKTAGAREELFTYNPTPFDETRLSARNEVPRCQKWEFERRTEMGQTFNDVAWQRQCAIYRQCARLKSSPIKPKLPGFHWRLRRWTLSCARELCVQGRANTHKRKTSSKTFIFQCTNPKSSRITDPLRRMGLCPQWPTHAPRARRGPPR